MAQPPRIAYLIEPRFPGGTSSAVAAELRAIEPMVRPVIHDAASAMFPKRALAQVLTDTLADLRLPLLDGDRPVSAEMVVVHNPAFLKFQSDLGRPIYCRDLVVVTHENFLRPGNVEAFDIGKCLGALDRASLSLNKWLAPVSPSNRETVAEWLAIAEPKIRQRWRLAPSDWFNIIDHPRARPRPQPRDRRGRLSRPGWEKFPAPADLDLCFPATAETNLILGADHLLKADIVRPHWRLLPFGMLPVASFFEEIDFLVHFTAPGWRESFGRVLAEGIASGKVVLSDPETAANFGGAVIGCQPAQVDALIGHYIAEPAAYRDHVLRAQAHLDRYAPTAFRQMLETFGSPARRMAA
ncbi:hypothetical protein OU426_04485 [Frigidibacter sp. RF13]|uniref:hypothetical protein n=1 Tax=Frigidibacter sp. RF13 TaxID=2997340 RepID=UPI002270355E|nr:hypothetical protein [Frigidibacter sp. RF13]MCY1126103.1 hypothetical protein [Frigidibacter sp. RF13]